MAKERRLALSLCPGGGRKREGWVKERRLATKWSLWRCRGVEVGRVQGRGGDASGSGVLRVQVLR